MKNLLKNSGLFLIVCLAVSCSKKTTAETPATTADSTAASTEMSQSAPQSADEIGGKTWRLTEMMGVPIKVKSPEDAPFIKLNTADKKYEGDGGCNTINGTFEIKPEVMQIKFGDVVSTKMACDNLKMENEFKVALTSADNYIVTGETMTLNKGKMSSLAKFVQVK